MAGGHTPNFRIGLEKPAYPNLYHGASRVSGRCPSPADPAASRASRPRLPADLACGQLLSSAPGGSRAQLTLAYPPALARG